MREVEGLKYSVHASSILDTEDVNATPVMSNKSKLVCTILDQVDLYLKAAIFALLNLM